MNTYKKMSGTLAIKMLLLLSFLCCCQGVIAQTIPKCFGCVLDASNEEPLPKVKIILLSGKATVYSDSLGLFGIGEVFRNDTLVFLLSDYNLKMIPMAAIPISGAMGDIYLERMGMGTLKTVDVVYTGIQQLKQQNTTGSYTVINSKKLNEQVSTDLLSRLTSISNGIINVPASVPGSSAGKGLNIRGGSTLTTSISSPLVIVDNFEYAGDLENINPNDVASVTFLKDASAASIWGARAANGVLVVTTKKSGFNRSTHIRLNTNLTIVQKPDLFKIRQMSSSDFMEVEKFLYHKGYYNSYISRPQNGALLPYSQLLSDLDKGFVTQNYFDSTENKMKNHDVRSDYSKYMYRTGINQQYALEAEGGSERYNWRLSMGLDRNNSVNDVLYQRTNFQLTNGVKLTKNWDASISVFFTSSKSEDGRPGYNDITRSLGRLAPYTSFVQNDGSPAGLYLKYGKNLIDTIGNGLLLDWKYYPLEDYKQRSNIDKLMDLNLSASTTYRTAFGLSASLMYRYERQRMDGYQYYGAESYYARDLVNSFSAIDYAAHSIIFNVPKGGIMTTTNETMTAQNIRGQLAFSKLVSYSRLNLILGGEIGDKEQASNVFSAYGYSPETLTYANTDFVNYYPNILTGRTTLIPSNISFGKTDTRIVSLFGNGEYTWKDRYVFSSSFRRDAANLFGVDVNDKWKPLWSSGFAWTLSKEPFFHVGFVEDFRIRATYGTQGNVDPSMVAKTTLYYYSENNAYSRQPYAYIKNYYNPDLKWEQTAIMNLGADFRLFQGVVKGSVEYYRKHISDMYGSAAVDPTSGLGTTYLTQNVGAMNMSGWDIQFDITNLRTHSFNWTSEYIVNTNFSKVTKSILFGTRYSQNFVGGGILGLEGYPGMGYFAYKWGGLDHETGAPMGIVDGKKSMDYDAILNDTSLSSIKFVGTITPKIYGSMGQEFSYKNLSLSFRFVYKFGYYFRRPSINYYSLARNASGDPDYANRWMMPGDEDKTDIPAFIYPVNANRDGMYTQAEVLATKGDHIRLQYINLSYKLHPLGHKKNFQTSLYAVCNNVGIVWKANKYGIDPDYQNIPAGRRFSFGFSVNF